MFRPVRSGAAWRRSPHQKSAGRERKGREGRKERKKRRKKREREEKGNKGRGDLERKRYYAYMGVKHPLRHVRTVKRLLKTRRS